VRGGFTGLLICLTNIREPAPMGIIPNMALIPPFLFQFLSAKTKVCADAISIADFYDRLLTRKDRTLLCHYQPAIQIVSVNQKAHWILS
jgi:hypothetical protein